LQRPRTIGGEKKRSSPQSKGKGDYWRKKGVIHPPISKERVIGRGKKGKGGGGDVFPTFKRRERAIGRPKRIS
jgi:hypothetical protein